MDKLKNLTDGELIQLMESPKEYSPYALGMEYLRRNRDEVNERISSPVDVLPLVVGYARRKQEHFITITLNGAHVPIKRNVISKGLVNKTITNPREVFRKAISQNAVAIIVVHNNPSGNVEPSAEDKEITQRLKEAGSVIGISLLDHIIFTRDNYYSFLEKERLV